MEETYVQCSHCGEAVEEGQLTGDLCETCDEDLGTCDACSSRVEMYDLIQSADDTGLICDECSGTYRYPLCTCCNHPLYRHNAIMIHNGDRICQSCYSEHYDTCYDCSEIHLYNDMNHHNGDMYCDSCHEEIRKKGYRGFLQGYSYKPSPEYKRATGEPRNQDNDPALPRNIYYGLELEVDDGTLTESEAAQLQATLPWCYFKEDGSLENGGFEIVTHPGTYKFHHEMKTRYEDAFHQLENCDFESESPDSSSCGLHIHVSRSAFADLDQLTRFCLMFEHWSEQMRKFSRRDDNNLDRWTAFYDITCKRTLKKVVEDGASNSRYRAVNLNNAKTVEVRLFNGTLDVDVFMAALQLVDALVKASKNPADISWNQFTRFYAGHYPELKAYLEELALFKLEYTARPKPEVLTVTPLDVTNLPRFTESRLLWANGELENDFLTRLQQIANDSDLPPRSRRIARDNYRIAFEAIANMYPARLRNAMMEHQRTVRDMIMNTTPAGVDHLYSSFHRYIGGSFRQLFLTNWLRFGKDSRPWDLEWMRGCMIEDYIMMDNLFETHELIEVMKVLIPENAHDWIPLPTLNEVREEVTANPHDMHTPEWFEHEVRNTAHLIGSIPTPEVLETIRQEVRRIHREQPSHYDMSDALLEYRRRRGRPDGCLYTVWSDGWYHSVVEYANSTAIRETLYLGDIEAIISNADRTLVTPFEAVQREVQRLNAEYRTQFQVEVDPVPAPNFHGASPISCDDVLVEPEEVPTAPIRIREQRRDQTVEWTIPERRSIQFPSIASIANANTN